MPLSGFISFAFVLRCREAPKRCWTPGSARFLADCPMREGHKATAKRTILKVHRLMRTYAKFGILMVLIVGSLVWLAVGGVKDTKTYYKTIPELAKMGSTAQGQRLRVGGDVQPGSIRKDAAQVSFVLHQGPEILKVVYSGTDPLPDTFRDNANALADGRLGAEGVF